MLNLTTPSGYGWNRPARFTHRATALPQHCTDCGSLIAVGEPYLCPRLWWPFPALGLAFCVPCAAGKVEHDHQLGVAA